MTGSTPAPHPDFIEPCLATLRETIPSRGKWIYEIKLDGYRTQAHLVDGKPAIFTRRGYDWTERFGPLAQALQELPASSLILDGEVVVLDERGISAFPQLQEDLARGRTDRLTYYAFDLLYIDGYDLRGAPLVERKRLLERLLEGRVGKMRLSEHLEVDGAAFFKRVCSMHLEGIIGKQPDAPYRSGRQESWIKVKCHRTETFPIIAFVEKLGAHPRRAASLYIGRWHGDRLLYAGKAQTGFTEATLRELRERLDPFIRQTSPLSMPIKKPKATWVEPRLEAEIQYSAVTAEGLLREPVFRGIRDDLVPLSEPRAIHASASSMRPARSSPAVPAENVLQLLPDAVVPSTDELARYWHSVTKRALKHLARRPLKLVRHVNSTTFYHKGPLPPVPEAVHQLKVQKREGGEGTRLWVDDLEGLLGLVEIGVVEVHPWNATVDDIEHPDTLVFDLDPGEGVSWNFVVETAIGMRDLLIEEGLTSWPKLTGGKGLHLMVPITPDLDHDEAHRYCKELAQRFAAKDPGLYTISAALMKRPGRLFIDYLRNGRGTTAVGTYSPRARSGFPIAAPASWREVEAGVRPDTYSLRKPARRG
jgi:bifunctional non-homologous end joining protein LigD